MESINKNSEIQSGKEKNQIKRLSPEKGPLKIKDKLNQSQQKSYFQKHKLLIILLSILICIIIVSTILSIVFFGEKKDDTPVIVEIKRGINQIDYYYLNQRQIIDVENINSNENLRELEDKFNKTSKLVFINSLIAVNTFEIKRQNGRDVFKSLILIKELNTTVDNEQEQNILSLDFDLTKEDKDEETQKEIINIPLIQVEFYKNGTIINEYVPKNLNISYLELLEYSKEKLIPLVAESLYKNNNLRALGEDEEKFSFEENKQENIVILKREINKKTYNNEYIIKNSLHKGNMSTTIINGTIESIEFNASLSLLVNNENENENETFVKSPYHNISSKLYEKFTLISSDINEQTTNNLKYLAQTLLLINKNVYKKKNEEEEEDNLEKNSNLRKITLSSSLNGNINENISTSFREPNVGIKINFKQNSQACCCCVVVIIIIIIVIVILI